MSLLFRLPEAHCGGRKEGRGSREEGQRGAGAHCQGACRRLDSKRKPLSHCQSQAQLSFCSNYDKDVFNLCFWCVLTFRFFSSALCSQFRNHPEVKCFPLQSCSKPNKIIFHGIVVLFYSSVLVHELSLQTQRLNQTSWYLITSYFQCNVFFFPRGSSVTVNAETKCVRSYVPVLHRRWAHGKSLLVILPLFSSNPRIGVSRQWQKSASWTEVCPPPVLSCCYIVSLIMTAVLALSIK